MFCVWLYPSSSTSIPVFAVFIVLVLKLCSLFLWVCLPRFHKLQFPSGPAINNDQSPIRFLHLPPWPYLFDASLESRCFIPLINPQWTKSFVPFVLSPSFLASIIAIHGSSLHRHRAYYNAKPPLIYLWRTWRSMEDSNK